MSDEKDIENLLADGQVDDNLVSELYNEIVEIDGNVYLAGNYCVCAQYRNGRCMRYDCKW